MKRMRVLRIWLVLLPVLVAATEGAALVVDRFAPPSYEGVELFAASNRSSAFLPLALALGVGAVLCALASLATSAPKRDRLPRWAFACLPPVLFTVQEHIEYVLQHHSAPTSVALSWTFAAGLLLQVPLIALAYLLARVLVGAAVAISERRMRSPVLRRVPPKVARPGSSRPRRLQSVGDRTLTRGPPLPIAV